jgi:hypothetical protein
MQNALHCINYKQHKLFKLGFAQMCIHRGNVYYIVSDNCWLMLLYPNQKFTILSDEVGEGGSGKQVIQHRGGID